MVNIRTYDGWSHTSLTDRKNERALLSAFVAAIAIEPAGNRKNLWRNAQRAGGLEL
jgi:hypothetical protein